VWGFAVGDLNQDGFQDMVSVSSVEFYKRDTFEPAIELLQDIYGDLNGNYFCVFIIILYECSQ